MVVGVHSYITFAIDDDAAPPARPRCGDESVHARVDVHASWIARTSAGDVVLTREGSSGGLSPDHAAKRPREAAPDEPARIADQTETSGCSLAAGPRDGPPSVWLLMLSVFAGRRARRWSASMSCSRSCATRAKLACRPSPRFALQSGAIGKACFLTKLDRWQRRGPKGASSGPCNPDREQPTESTK